MKTELDLFNPCGEALEFRMKFDTFEQAWSSCEYGDWMEWIALRLGVDDRKFVLAKGLVVKTVQHLMNDQRSIDAVDAAIAYGNGKINVDGLRAASRAALDAHSELGAASVAHAAYYAYASASAVHAVDAAADAAAYYAAHASADAAYAFARAATNTFPSTVKEDSLRKSADIFREIITDEVLKQINEL